MNKTLTYLIVVVNLNGLLELYWATIKQIMSFVLHIENEDCEYCFSLMEDLAKDEVHII